MLLFVPSFEHFLFHIEFVNFFYEKVNLNFKVFIFLNKYNLKLFIHVLCDTCYDHSTSVVEIYSHVISSKFKLLLLIRLLHITLIKERKKKKKKARFVPCI